MTKVQKIVIVVSIVLALAVVGGALALSRSAKPEPAVHPAPQALRDVSAAELKSADGKEGRTCLIAVDGTVYKIDDFSVWQDGDHRPSRGEAYCGADLSQVIDKSPHGRDVLDKIIKVGPLKP